MHSSKAHPELASASAPERALERFAAGVAHEARNQIFALSATLDALEARFSRALEHPPHFEVMREELARLTTLMRHLAELGQPNAPLLGVGRVGEVVLDAVSRVQPLARGRSIALAVRTDEARANLDHEQLSRALVRLLEFSIRRSPVSGVIEIALVPDGGLARLTVVDRGPCLEVLQLERLFEPFLSLDGAQRGLELTLARRTITDHGGSVAVENRESGGVSWTISLPLAKTA